MRWGTSTRKCYFSEGKFYCLKVKFFELREFPYLSLTPRYHQSLIFLLSICVKTYSIGMVFLSDWSGSVNFWRKILKSMSLEKIKQFVCFFNSFLPKIDYQLDALLSTKLTEFVYSIYIFLCNCILSLKYFHFSIEWLETVMICYFIYTTTGYSIPNGCDIVLVLNQISMLF